MSINFCKKCGRILRIQKIDEVNAYSFCDSCNEFELIKTENVKEVSSNERIEKQNDKGEGFEDEKNRLATYPNVCKKCGYGFAQILDLGIFYSDEDNLILLKCGKCGFSERIGRKVS